MKRRYLSSDWSEVAGELILRAPNFELPSGMYLSRVSRCKSMEAGSNYSLNTHVVIVGLFVGANRKIEHAQRTDAELVDSRTDWPLLCSQLASSCVQARYLVFGGWWERGGSEFVSVTTEDNNTDSATKTDVPHSFQDDLSLSKVSSPGVLASEAPVLGEWNAGDHNFPSDTSRDGSGKPIEKIRELLITEHALLVASFSLRFTIRAISTIKGLTVTASIDHEEGRRSLVEGEVGCTRTNRVWIDGSLVVMPWIDCSFVESSGVLVPVVCNLMVIQHMDPGQIGF
jgi:hypothetical protein